MEKGVKIIDFSEVPSDILPLIVSLIARVIFSVQQWTKSQCSWQQNGNKKSDSVCFTDNSNNIDTL